MSKIKFIAEIGLNHNGNKDLIFELIRNASFCGVDYVKFQLGWRGKVDEMNHFDSEILESIYNFGELYNVEILFSVFDNASLDLLLPFKPKLIKIASRTLKNDIELVKKIHNHGINTLSSVGMIDLNNIPDFDNDLNRFLFCKSKYPTYINDLTDFPKNFSKSKFIGYSDHCLGISNCLIAISRGAEIIEKHFTLDKSDTTIRDHTLSATPSELSDLVKYGREIAIYSK
jgi:sialic acid synthase SpsE